MSSAYPGSPRLLKGALVVFETVAPIPTNLIAFQYNPESVTRSIESQNARDPTGARRWIERPTPLNTPLERLRLTIELDATDQLEDGSLVARATGLHPELAALELLLYPTSAQKILGTILSAVGSAFITAADEALVLLVWGPLRVLPVLVESLSINEEAFDQLLNPIRAKVDLELRSLTAGELSHAGKIFGAIDVVNLIAKEVLARENAVTSVEEIIGAASFPPGAAL
jgi:hypothetical protein